MTKKRVFTVVCAVAALASTSSAIRPHAPSRAVYDRATDPHGFTVYMNNGGWCWFQDPRAILHHNHVVIGAIQGNGDGPALIGSYDLSAKKQLGNFVADPKMDRDDHNSPVFYPRPDGTLLAVYARHDGGCKFHFYRISQSEDFTKWGEEHRIDHTAFLTGAKDSVSYMNLYNMSREGKLYNFFRGFNFNPCFVTSDDQGLSWSGDTHLIQNELGGRQRPYARYCGNGVDTVHISFTDAHPLYFGNSIYYAAFRNGKFYRADGSLIKDLKTGGPLKPSEAELIYKGNAKKGRNQTDAAWTSSIVYDANGYPHIAYSVHKSDVDHRYRIASWNGAKWIDREVAYGGKCLYKTQNHYTGLITLDPKDPSYAVISTSVNPSTGVDSGGFHEIYRAKVTLSDDVTTLQWIAVTKNSPVYNIRPVILHEGTRRVVLWNRGEYLDFLDYDFDTVGYEENTGE